MTFYKTISALIISLSLFSSNGFSMEIENDFEDKNHTSLFTSRQEDFDEKAQGKFADAIKICMDTKYGRECDYDYAMKVCGADSYRLSPLIIWGKYIGDIVDSDNYERLITIELHHIAGDMMHIAKFEKDHGYREKVKSAMRYEFQETWFEEKAKDYSSSSKIAALKIPDMPNEYGNSDMCEAFIEMIGFFRRWDELQKTSMKVSDQSELYRQIKHKYRDKKVYPYPKDNGPLLKYRKQRKLSLFWHPMHFSVYDSHIYRKARERETTYYPPIPSNRSYAHSPSTLGGYKKPYCSPSSNFCQDPATCTNLNCKQRLN